MIPNHPSRSLLLTLPNVITGGRMGLIPLIVGLFYVPEAWAVWLRTGLFVLACVTDYLDGYLARAYQQSSFLGQLLDPLADKLLVVLCLMMLVGFQIITGPLLIPVVLIVAREIIIPGLRNLNPKSARRVGVTSLGKWKTALQMSVMTLLMLDDGHASFHPWRQVAEGGLWAVAAFTVWTGYLYGRQMFALPRDPSAS